MKKFEWLHKIRKKKKNKEMKKKIEIFSALKVSLDMGGTLRLPNFMESRPSDY